ncbi:MAG: hypothetical protein A3K19_04225 [Lentisphaerae bacterium RIFOXYB12_FULL_65_16]|nr:MAG: hypothetical protein A3K18_09475 [Lentisphaerae bacterium RIFOXYA12_64_32]OGV84290.1 MAG: hypothetical protein A3K19_04225 [Lentisphaerae bacterium RIFOXYB12_FULL_65_16]
MKEIPFFAELRRPLYPLPVPVFDRSKPGKGEFAITSEWCISVPADASEQVRMAADDLRKFLLEGGIRVAYCRQTSKGQPSIRLKKGGARGAAPENYRIRIRPDGIVITGTDDSGVMYGAFFLEELMKQRRAPILKPGNISRRPILRTRILRSPMSFFHRQELPTVLDAYPETYLLRMAHHGFNGIWLRGRLHEMVKVRAFPEFGLDSDRILRDVNTLVQRAAKYGIKVFFYFNEPLAMRKDSGFFDRYPHLKGQSHGSEEVFAMCTSTPEVQVFLRDGMKYLFTKVSGLSGVILITASEFHTHCFSHFATRNQAPGVWREKMECPRCRTRTPQAVIGEVIGCINDGVKAARPDAEVIAWNWSWTLYEDEPQPGVIKALPKGVGVMADFERGGKRVTDGFKHMVDEYSQTYVGPSERFRGTAKVARETKRGMYAKLQIGVTHEIASVPYFPVYRKLAEKFLSLNRQHAIGAMECWNFGNILSPNTELANAFSWAPLPKSIDAYLRRIAERDFGAKAAAPLVKAWDCFARATEHYPFSIPLLYWGPQHFGPAFPLYFKPVNRHMPIPWLLPADVKYDTDFSWMQYTKFGDEIANYLGPFTPEKLVSCFDNLVREWQRGVDFMRKALRGVPKSCRANAEREYTVAAAVLSQFTTVRNVTEFVHLRNRYGQEKNAAAKKRLLQTLLTIAEGEVKNSLACRDLAERNNQLGFHGEAFGYDYTPAKINAKVRTTQTSIAQIRKALSKLV